MFALFAMIVSTAWGGELAGVKMPDQATLGGQTLVLNGMGLREKYFFDIYVGGLYLPTKTKDGAAAISSDVPKRIVMHFIYSDVPADKVRETFSEGFENAPGGAAMSAQVDQINGWMVDLTTGDEIVIDYVPGTGTTFKVKGATKGTIPGTDFMKALFNVYLGPTPPTAKLKAGMLGG